MNGVFGFVDNTCYMSLIAMILKNAYVIMNGYQSSYFFQCQPPSFEDAGPRLYMIRNTVEVDK